jgi:hypothetical protein
MAGYSILNPNQSYDVPVYLTTFMILIIIMLFLILTVFTLEHHAKGIRIKEDDKVGHIFKRY